MLKVTKKLEIAKFGRQAIASLIYNHQLMRSKMILKFNSNNRNKKLTATFSLQKSSATKTITLKGQTAKTLIALIKAKQKGCTALEISSWALRLSGYIHILRTKYCLNIITKKEPHNGGFHGRYFLLDEVDILESKDNDRG